jgi:orotate phosphoribosyltransferase-like protein
MTYERSRIIEERFQKALALIKKRRLNAGQLALELGVSRPTADFGEIGHQSRSKPATGSAKSATLCGLGWNSTELKLV